MSLDVKEVKALCQSTTDLDLRDVDRFELDDKGVWHGVTARGVPTGVQVSIVLTVIQPDSEKRRRVPCSPCHVPSD